MRFKVREGFVVHHRRLVEVPGLVEGETTVEIQESSFYAKQIVEFDADEAREHVHKLEPFDKEAKAWLESLAVAFDAPAPAAPAGASLEQLVGLLAEALKVAGTAPAPAASAAPADQAGAGG